ncbi:HtaA domain-containing protein [Microbacterium sp. LRZ72]|uniref:HtaA domain-containing protein n=1 Tax=Microbacterium sp. LRZ72 TaxID=2942481 RepID=UPI0029B17805|nr:HtaA domain-containing protein [Microbacterium sp. LRZ72]MDX2377504.1 HtaA domain-containing protein [Microbacterium sp. LRZ72]
MSIRRLRRVCAAAGLAGFLALGGGALAAPAAAETSVPTGACVADDAEMTWGFKESFRSYISGSIAEGEWETFGGADYTTPSFSWSSGAGEFAPATGTGEISFEGGVRFTGHDGLLDTTIADPVLVLDGGDSGQLMLDVSGVAMEDAMAGDDTATTREGVAFVDLDTSALTVAEDEASVTVTAEGAPTAITADGFEAFGSYEAGTAFDAISFTLTASCPVAPQEEAAPTASPQSPDAVDAGATAGAAPDGVWIAAIGGAVILGAAVLVAVLVSRRRARGSGGGIDGGSS